MFFNKKDYVRVSISYDTRTPISILEELSKDKSLVVRYSVALNSSTPISILEELSNDKDEPVRYWVARNPNWIKWTKRKT